MQQGYKLQEIDDMDILYFMDVLIANANKPKEKHYIDDVL